MSEAEQSGSSAGVEPRTTISALRCYRGVQPVEEQANTVPLSRIVLVKRRNG